MYNEDFFSVVEGVLILNKEYIRGIPEYRTIIERDKGSEGDHDGRKKHYAFKEFFYIYLRASLFSYINRGGFDEKDAHKLATKDAKLESNYKPDVAVKAAILWYRENQLKMLPTLASIWTILKTLRLTDTLAAKILADLSSRLERWEETLASDEPQNIADAQSNNNVMLEKIDQVLSLAKKVPIAIEGLEKLAERLLVEQSGSNITRGGREKGNRADPK